MYWIELHIHTEIGSLDSTLNYEEMIKEYERIGVDGVCVTEHIKWRKLKKEEYESLYGAYEKGKDEKNIDIFPGAEVKLENGHEYLVLGIKIPIELFGTDWDCAVEKIHSLGGIIIKSHPYREEDIVIPYDGIELYNFHSSTEKNMKTIEYSKKNNNIIELVGCDAHSDDVTGMAITVLENRPKDNIELIKMLKNEDVVEYIISGIELKKEDLNEKLFDGSINCRF